MKVVLMISSLLVGDDGAVRTAEHSQVFNNASACTNAVAIREGIVMQPVLNGYRLVVQHDTKYSKGETTFVCAYLGEEK